LVVPSELASNHCQSITRTSQVWYGKTAFGVKKNRNRLPPKRGKINRPRNGLRTNNQIIFRLHAEQETLN